MVCDPHYISYINTLYDSNIYQFITYMANNQNPAPTEDSDPFISALWYCFYLLETTSYKVINVYLLNSAAFQRHQEALYYILSSCQFVGILIGLTTAALLYCWCFRREVQRCREILDLVRRESYDMGEGERVDNI
jgi:hypothetical protein